MHSGYTTSQENCKRQRTKRVVDNLLSSCGARPALPPVTEARKLDAIRNILERRDDAATKCAMIGVILSLSVEAE